MRILIVTATAAEVAPLLARLKGGGERGPRTRSYRAPGHDVDVLTTGIGMVPTSVWTARALMESSYDAALNAGVCGSFDPLLRPGVVVHVVSDRLSELGAEDGDAIRSLQEIGLASDAERVVARAPEIPALERLPQVNGITVNTVHGSDRSIADAMRRFNAQVETMEGAAFMYACSTAPVPFAQIRAVSNVVERRNRAAWRLDEAIDALGVVLRDLLEA